MRRKSLVGEKKRGNGLLGKIVRTAGFLMVAFGAAVLGVTTLMGLVDSLGSTADAFADHVTNMGDFLSNLGIPNLLFIAQISLLAGMITLVWAIGKSITSKVIHTVITLIVTVYFIFQPAHSILFLVHDGQLPAAVTNFTNANRVWFDKFDTLFVNYPMLMGGIITAIYVLVSNVVLGKRKPKRLSISLVNGGFGVITFLTFTAGILLPILAAHVDFIDTVMTSNYYFTTVYGGLALSFVLQTLGSILGTIFFFVK